MKRFCWIFLTLACAALGCQSTSLTSNPPDEMILPGFIKIDDRMLAGAVCRKYRIDDTGREVWIYQPQKAASDTLILIPASWSNGISGGKLNAMDEMLATGFAQSGITVAAYDVGEVAPLDADSIDDFKRAIHSVIDDGGLADARNALTIALMDSNRQRIVTLGKGAASSLALRAAVRDDRVDACVMIDPPESIRSGTVEVVIDLMKSSMPELDKFLTTDDFDPLVGRVRVPTVVVNLQHEDARITPAELLSASPHFDRLRANAIRISNPFPTDMLPEEGFTQISEWISRQPVTPAARSSRVANGK